MLESASSTAATRLLLSLARCLYARLAQRKVWRRQVPGLGVGVGAGAGLCLGADIEPDQPSQGAETSNSCLAKLCPIHCVAQRLKQDPRRVLTGWKRVRAQSEPRGSAG